LELTPETSVHELRRQVAEATGVGSWQLRLLYGDTELAGPGSLVDPFLYVCCRLFVVCWSFVGRLLVVC